MKKTLIPILVIVAAFIQSCSGPAGIDGRDGLDGKDGLNIVAQTFEVQKVNFTAANNYEYVQTFSSAKILGVQPSDAVLVYILYDLTSTGNPIWRLLPQAIDMPRGIVMNFDYTPTDFSAFIDAPTGALKATVGTDWTQNQKLRVVVIPSDFTARKDAEVVDYKDYESVKAYYNLDENKIAPVKAH